MIKKIQQYLKEQAIDAWVVYQFIDMNPMFNKLVGAEDTVVTRRTFLIIPQEGEVCIVHSKIDGGLKDLGYKSITYSSYESFKQKSKAIIGSYNTVAMEFSPLSAIPHISKVDAGIIDLVRSFGVTVVSSGDLMQIMNSLNSQEVESHVQAAKKLDEIRKKTFEYIETSLQQKREVSEYTIQQYILNAMEREAVETVYQPQSVINEHAARGHYIPRKNNAKVLQKGDLLLVDMWLRLKKEYAIYADITWMLYRGKKVPQDIQDVFDTVKNARDKAIAYMRASVTSGKTMKGYEVDQIARDYIRQRGYEKYFINRLGHSIGTFVHGDQTHLDNFENRDERQIVPNHITSVEPCIKIPGKFGVRTEVDVLVTDTDVQVTTEMQDSIYLLPY